MKASPWTKSRPSVAGRKAARDLREVLWIEHDLDPSVGGPALFRVIARDRMRIRVPDRRQPLRLHASVIDEISYDGRSPGSGKLPIGLEFVLELCTDGDVIGMAFDPDLFVRDLVQHVADLF